MEQQTPDLKRKLKLSEVAAKLRERKVVTLRIHEGQLPLYLKAALATGFEVKKIASEGKEFPYKSEEHENRSVPTEDGKYYTGDFQPKVSSIKVQGKGYIEVSVERPESSKYLNNAPFWDNLRRLEQEQASPFPKSK